jgi:hypothetical protein
MQYRKSIPFISLVFIMMTTLMGSTVLASSIVDVFRTYVVIGKPDAGMKVGDEYYSMSAKNKRKSKLKIRTVTAQDAEADILKGSPSTGEKLVRVGSKEAGEIKSQSNQAVNQENGQPQRESQNSTMAGQWRTEFGLGLSYFKIRGGDLKYDLGAALALLEEYGWTHLFLESGLKFYQGGGKMERSGAEIKAAFNYVGIPLVVKYAFDEDSAFRLKGGLMISQFLSGKMKIKAGSLEDESDIKLKGSDALDELILLGFELSSPAGESGFWMEFLLNYGIKDYKDNSGALSTSTKAGNEGFSLLLGATF